MHSSQTAHYDETYGRAETTYDDRTRTHETVLKLDGYIGSDQELLKHKFSVSNVKTDSDTFSTTSTYDPITYTPTGFIPSQTDYDAKKLNTNYQLDINFDRDGYVRQGVSLLTEYQRATYDSTNFSQGKKKLSERNVAGEYRLFTEEDHSLSVSGRYTENVHYENAWTGRLSGAYRLSPNFRPHVSVGSAIQNYVGKRIDTFPMRTKMPSYTLVNLGVNYQVISNLNIYANLNNLFNKKYENILGYGQDGCNVYVGLKGSF